MPPGDGSPPADGSRGGYNRTARVARRFDPAWRAPRLQAARSVLRKPAQRRRSRVWRGREGVCAWGRALEVCVAQYHVMTASDDNWIRLNCISFAKCAFSSLGFKQSLADRRFRFPSRPFQPGQGSIDGRRRCRTPSRACKRPHSTRQRRSLNTSVLGRVRRTATGRSSQASKRSSTSRVTNARSSANASDSA